MHIHTRAHTRAHTHTHTHARVHTHINASAYTVHAQSKDLGYISIWQYIDTVTEFHIMILCFMSIEISKLL